MTYIIAKETAASASGVASIDVASWHGKYFQVSVIGITGTSTVTVTVTPAGGDAYEALVDGTIDLSAPTTVTITGNLDSVKATAATGTDVFTLVVGLI